MHVRRPHPFVCGAIGVVCCAAAAMAQPELVSNGGFETGNFSSWIVPPSVPNQSIFRIGSGAAAHSGNFYASFGSQQTQYIGQILPTVAGGEYELNFWLRRGSIGFGSFYVRWEGQVVFNQVLINSDFATWHEYTFPLHSNITGSFLEFGQNYFPGEFQIDDVSVVQVPAPGAAAVLGGAGLAALRRRRRRG